MHAWVGAMCTYHASPACLRCSVLAAAHTQPVLLSPDLRSALPRSRAPDRLVCLLPRCQLYRIVPRLTELQYDEMDLGPEDDEELMVPLQAAAREAMLLLKRQGVKGREALERVGWGGVEWGGGYARLLPLTRSRCPFAWSSPLVPLPLPSALLGS